MAVGRFNSTIGDGYTPICGECGVCLCWDISSAEYEENQPFWDAWICQDCNGGNPFQPNQKRAMPPLLIPRTEETKMIEFSKLALPFPPQDVEWRLQECGKKGDKIWAMCLAYITNRAIMQRLDDVCGPENWMNEYKAGPQGGVICGISIRCVDGWVTKWDGADNTQVEATKGGLSDAMKRAGVQWGIGRYLYNLEAGFAEIVPEGKKGEYRGKTKSNEYFQWNPPKLPAWALPPSTPPLKEQQQRQAPPTPDAPPPPPTEGKKPISEAQKTYFPRCKAALDTLHGSNIAAKKATIKANSALPAKGEYPAREGVEDYRALDGDRLKFCCHALEKLAEKQQPALCNDCRQPVNNHAPSCPQATPPQ